LETLPVSNRPVIINAGVSAMLKTLSAADAGIKAAYVDYLERLFAHFLKNGPPDEVSVYLESLVDQRPDPSRENDRIRVRLISEYVNRGMLYSAREMLRQVRTGVPIFSRVRFAFAGLYFDPVYLWIAVI